MKSFKKWSAQDRQKSLKLTNEAKKLGLIEEPKKCRACTKEKGIIHSHNKDYDVTLELVPKLITGTATEEEKAKIKDALVPLCWRCHMIYHSKHRNMSAYKKYVDEVTNGKIYPPVYKHNFEILKENGF